MTPPLAKFVKMTQQKKTHTDIKTNMTKLTLGRSCKCPLYYSNFPECLKGFLKVGGNTPKKIHILQEISSA